MLTSDQIDALRDLSGQVVDPVVDFLIEDIARRIAAAGQVTSTAEYQMWRAQNLGVSQKKVMARVRKLLGVSESEMEALLERSAELGHGFDLERFQTLEAVPFAENTGLQQILDTTVQMAREDLSNVTQTMGFITYDGKCEELTKAYEKSCDFAFQKVVTGAQDYTSAIRDAVRGLAEKGIRTIDYESGVHTSLEAAVRRNIMGGLGLMQERISQQDHDDLGCDGWEISAHGASAPDHEPYQGKQYSDEEYARLNGSLLRRIGTLNCGHSAMPIILGVNTPQYTDEELEEMRQKNEKGIEYQGKHYTMYEATQRQRSLERAMRSRKRRILIDESTGDKEKLQWDQIRLVRTREEYHRFSKAAGLREQWERAEAAGFTWKHGKAATAAMKERVASVGESAATMNWHRIPVAGGQTGTLYRKISPAKREIFSDADAVNSLIDQNVQNTNPAYKGALGPYGQNCQRCVATYEMRRRGYDVIARGATVDEQGKLSTKDALYYRWKSIFVGANFEVYGGYDGGKAEVISQMEKWGDGAVAEIRVLWNSREAHVFVAERVNGIVRFVDPQSGDTNCERYFTSATLGGTIMARIDNLEPSELIELCIKNRGGKT